MFQDSRNRSLLAMAVLIIGIFMLMRFPSSSTPTYAQSNVINSPNLVFPTIRIVRLDNRVTRFDTTTGELQRFNGDLTGPDANGSWLRFANGITQQTSGFLDLRRAGGGTFLVDLETGQTWILRDRGNIASWIRVQA